MSLPWWSRDFKWGRSVIYTGCWWSWPCSGNRFSEYDFTNTTPYQWSVRSIWQSVLCKDHISTLRRIHIHFFLTGVRNYRGSGGSSSLWLLTVPGTVLSTISPFLITFLLTLLNFQLQWWNSWHYCGLGHLSRSVYLLRPLSFPLLTFWVKWFCCWHYESSTHGLWPWPLQVVDASSQPCSQVLPEWSSCTLCTVFNIASAQPVAHPGAPFWAKQNAIRL